MTESFWSKMQYQLLDRCQWSTESELPSAVFVSLDVLYNPICRYTSTGNLRPVEFDSLHTAAINEARSTHRNRPGKRVSLRRRSRAVTLRNTHVPGGES
jgi:hypothetical protein